MILSGEDQSTGTKTCPNATLYTTNLTWIGPGSNLDLLEEKRSLKNKTNPNYLSGFSPYRILRLGYKSPEVIYLL